MQNKKTFELLNLLKELGKTTEINVKNYAINQGLSERTIRRYLDDLREFFGSEFIVQTKRGTYSAVDKNLMQTILLPNQKQKDEFEKLIDLLHIINPGFANVLPPAYKHIDEKLAKELADVFLIKGSPRENPINLEILAELKKAIKFRKYCDILLENRWLKNIKALKIIYCKGNWQLAIIDLQNPQNNGFCVLRLGFINKVILHSNTFNANPNTENFIQNMQTFLEGYGVTPYLCKVAVAPWCEKYFLRKKFFNSQKIEGRLENGWAEISFEITSDDMILMLARRWFPNFVILMPQSARDKFEALLAKYSEFKAEFAN